VILIQGQRIPHAGKGDRLHEGADRLGIRRNELLLGRDLPHTVHDPGLGGHDELLGRPLGDLPDHPLGRGDVQPFGVDVAESHAVDQLPGAATLGVHQHLGIGVRGAGFVEHLRADSFVHVAFAHPDLDTAIRPHPPHVAAEEEVGQEEDPNVRRNSVDDVERVAAGAAVVELGFDFCCGVDVAHRDVTGELGLPAAHVFGRDRRRERAPRTQIGQEHPLLRRENGSGLGHEVDATEDDDLGRGRSRLP
jgi:hypothetical protein